ncbi:MULTISPECIES: iron-containing alcohol dehydrogenase [unclassified Microbacterium]|uniref:3-dehydroquinate synthase family protein n=1 Tax=unclassified Microbacterium TaxID=2609290 RepID=UPI000CFE3519|nr:MULTISPECIES: iron-containing alcohol dehydrogenase [unclassified Microbacterium]PQZ53036.1 3-dehydroquinate synthase [Microbacterium sp. MYb43]PQZ73264.1 3-dehydroquinate synthase [Microbacterium sp. MYb40]PRB18716.1 3-dehydroquinate synthase [Microbacterium sp. MYb54]PRB24391.1 3-dehydroquinate synthase [Microbacterium sp. MYb50]PRB64439.1 3-dehydroquinate synthase [Microbacterium sp. MYb32]
MTLAEQAVSTTVIPYSVSGGLTHDGTTGAIRVVCELRIETETRVTVALFNPDNPALASAYEGAQRVVVVVAEDLRKTLGPRIESYFTTRAIPVLFIECPSSESEKTMASVMGLLRALGADGARVSRDERVLVVGGGVVADVAGLACALLHRRTPYVMVGTSVVSAIDAGPSPRTCVNADQFKNSAGVYHPPVVAFADPTLLETLASKHVRHGVAEIVKMALVDDIDLLEKIEEHGTALIETKFQMPHAPRDLASAILHAALVSYLRHEGPNYFEVHQSRPHAFGHTWSPGFERPLGLMHGHAVSIDMALTSAISVEKGLLAQSDLVRQIRLFQALGLSVLHPGLHDGALLISAQAAIQEKRGGVSLMAPAPALGLGRCQYLDEVSEPELFAAMERIGSLLGSSDGVGLEAFL